MKSDIINIPNLITLSRLLLALPLGSAILHDINDWVLILSFLIILSDFLDGFAARLLNQHSAFGKALDPIVDGFTALIVITALYLKSLIPAWYVQLIMIRYIITSLVLCYYRFSTKVTPSSTLSGKCSINIMAMTLLLAWIQVLPNTYVFFLYASTTMLLISLLDYLYTFGYKR